MFSGLYVALVTPFKVDGSLNEEKLRELVNFHVEAGTDGLVPCGTTGENPAMKGWDEHFRVIQIVAEEAKGRIQVIAGVGTNSTAQSIDNVKRLAGLGVDGALVITPYYNKPTQEGLIAHFQSIARESPVPLVLYNVPGRTGVNMLPETVGRLADEEMIHAVKEASGSLEQASWILQLCGERIAVLAGEDALIFPMLCVGGTGVISVLGNIVPKDVLAMIAAFRAGDIETARRWHLQLLPLARALFLETNPAPVKEALNILGFDVGGPRLPLVRMRESNIEELVKAMANYSLLRGKGSKRRGDASRSRA
ncbi:MAG: 4-hydroxy-tetrahydrodipicolinate synthase [Candidatus Eisenbacteria sp.]|nr:4-hydroxy-tetrahydrodipicolinate synthase [Candidatus Eisenbacteria bacterium]